MTIFEIYLDQHFHTTQELEYHEINGPHIQIGQIIQQIVMLEPKTILKNLSNIKNYISSSSVFSIFTRNLVVSFMMEKLMIKV